MAPFAGQDPTDILKMTPKPYGLLKTMSALLHVLIQIRIQYYKKSNNDNKQRFLQDIDARYHIRKYSMQYKN